MFAKINRKFQSTKKRKFQKLLNIGFIKKDHYLIAHPEKALVDYMYLVALGKKKMNDRLNISSLDREKVNRYTASFDHQLLNTRIWQLFKSSKNKQ